MLLTIELAKKSPAWSRLLLVIENTPAHRPVTQRAAVSIYGWSCAAIARAWNSPTATTWASLSTRSATLLLILPFVLGRFSAPDAAVWFVFSAVLAVQSVLGFGFSPSFGRLIAYARAGAKVKDMGDLRVNKPITAQAEINWDAIDRLCSCMGTVFAALATISLVLMGTVGTLAVKRPIDATAEPISMWLAWSIIVLVSSLSFRTLYYVTYLQGMDSVTEWRRWETVTSIGGILSAFATLLAGGGVFELVIAYQFWSVVNLWLFRKLCRRIHDGRFQHFGRKPWDRGVFSLVWASAWKTGITNVLSYGLVQSTGVVQAQFASAAATASYNFTLRLASFFAQIVQAPFLTKLPELARLRALGDQSGLRVLAGRGMLITHWTTVLLVGGSTLFVPVALRAIGSRSVQFDPLLWSLFGMNLFLERHGGMLNQVRNLTNRPVEHIGVAAYFLLSVSQMFLLYGTFGVYAYPLAMLGTQLLFGLWFSSAAAYPVLGGRAFVFERSVSIPPFATLTFICVAAILWAAER